MTDYHEQYLVAAKAIEDLTNTVRYSIGKRTTDVESVELLGDGLVAIALSNLAVAEAIHRVAASLGSVPVVVNSTGSVTLDPEAVAEAVNQILNRKERNA